MPAVIRRSVFGSSAVVSLVARLREQQESFAETGKTRIS